MFVQPPTWPEEFAKRYRENGCWRGETFSGCFVNAPYR